MNVESGQLRRYIRLVFFGACCCLTVYTGIENIKYFGGSVFAEPRDIAFSIVTYVSWAIIFVMSVLTDKKKIAKKTILAVLLSIYVLACFGGVPRIIAFSPLMGIAMATIKGVDQFWMLSLLYLGWVIMVELTDLMNMCKGNNIKNSKCK